MKYLRQYIRQILSEGSLRTQGLAALTSETPDGRKAIIYDTTALEDTIHNTPGLSKQETIATISQDAIRGFIVVGPPVGRGPCRGAWATIYSAGPGYGKEVYAAGHALTPDGRLMPDRFFVSDDARRGWLQQTHRPRQPLDDISNPKTPPKEDDCKAHTLPQEQHLNYVYEPTGDENQFLRTLTLAHEETLRTLEDTISPPDLEHIISEAGDDFFDVHFT
jgi:hypothetical protein